MGIPGVDFDVFRRGAFALRIHRTRNLQGVPDAPQYTWRLVDLHEMPGAKIAAMVHPDTPSARNGTAMIFLQVGRPDALAFNVQIHPGITAPSGVMAGNTRAYLVGSIDGAHYVLETDAALKDLAAQATPPLALDIGDPVVVLYHEPWYAAAAATVNGSGTDGFMDDVEIHGHFTLFWGKPEGLLE